ncbi:hypothetical protein LPUS_07846 [Lasallia pustulata]|nr:hypothetical protein LPUS_07846 [Lasallia pustulata]
MSSQPNPSPLSPLPSSSAQPAQSRSTSSLAPKPRTKPMKKRKLTGPIPHRQPRIKGSVKSTAISKPERTKYYLWPSASRGEVVLAEKDYKRVNDLLLRLDYADKETALKSTERWIDEVAVAAGQKSWGMTVEGAKESSIADDAEEANPTSLDMTLIKKKKRVSAEGDVQEAAYQSLDPAAAPKMMDTGLVRKKPKLVPAPSEPSASSVENGINVLGAGLVRKKVKA